MPINNLISWKSTTHQEMMSMTEQLQMLNFELQAAQQEDEGATYRIEELERYQTMSNEAASHWNLDIHNYVRNSMNNGTRERNHGTCGR